MHQRAFHFSRTEEPDAFLLHLTIVFKEFMDGNGLGRDAPVLSEVD